MKSFTWSQAEGANLTMKAEIEEVPGKLGDNPELEPEGIGEKIAVRIQEKIEEIKEILGMP